MRFLKVNPDDADENQSSSSSKSFKSSLRSNKRSSSRFLNKKIVSWHDYEVNPKDGTHRGNMTDRPTRNRKLDRFGNELLSFDLSEDGVKSTTSSEKRRQQIQEWVT